MEFRTPEDYRLSDEYQHHSFRYPGRKRRKIITASVASGVNELDSVQYLCSDYDEKYQEALKMAVEMAKNKADAMAEAAGMTVVKAVNISEDGYYPQARYNTAGASAKQMMMEDAAADMALCREKCP